jgi:hypothetical protein
MHAFLRSTLATAVVLAALVPATAQAQSTFTSFAEFIDAVGPSGVDSYDDLPAFAVVPGPLDRQAGSYGYSVATNEAPDNLFFPLENPAVSNDVWLSTENADAALNFGGFDSEVRAIGGHFFATDLDGAVSGTRLFLVAEDLMGNRVEQTLTPLTSGAFFGVSFDFGIASLRVAAENDPQSIEAYFATVNDLVLAEAVAPVPVPEPSALLLLSAALLLLVARRQRRRA